MSVSRSSSPPVRDGMEPLGVTSVALNLLTVVLWGGTPVAISYSIDTLPPVAVAGLRFVLAAGFMLVWCRVEGTDLTLKPGQRSLALIAGMLLFVQIGVFNWGIRESNSSHATLFINTFIFWVAGFEHFVTRTSRLTLQRALGLVVAASGVALILVDTRPDDGVTATADVATFGGDLLLATSGLLLGIKIMFTKHAVRHVEPGKLIFWHDVIGVALFGLWSVAFEEVSLDKFSQPAVWGLLYQGVLVAGLCFVVQARLLRRHAASQIAVFSFATPLFGIVAAVLFRGDDLSPWLFVSGICVAVGILLVNITPPVGWDD